MLLEEFKGCLSDRIVVYLNEQKVTTLSHQAAVLSDEFVLTHKNVFASARPEKLQIDSSQSQTSRSRFSPPCNKEERECFYCHKKGHVIADCLALKRKQQPQPKGVGFVKAFKSAATVNTEERIDESYWPFVSKGLISLSGKMEDQEEIRTLRDTGAMQVKYSCLSDNTFCGSSVIVQGIEMGCVKFPLHYVHLQSELCTGLVRIAVCPSLPVKGVDFILGNDLAGGKVMSVIEVVEEPNAFCELEGLSETYYDVFPACAVTRAQSRRVGDVVDLSNSFMFPLLSGDTLLDVNLEKKNSSKIENKGVVESDAELLKLPVSREKIIAAQKEDKTLVAAFNSAVSLDVVKDKKFAYFIDKDLLMRKWCSHADENSDWNVVYQIVVPFSYRQHVLFLAHDHQLAGHLGVTKTYNRILSHFFWPGLKKDVAYYCRTCHTCQIVGKPNQKIPPAPLIPIPAIGEPFEHVMVDCVGPLPKTKSGNQFLLTIMCVATRFPEAIPLRKRFLCGQQGIGEILFHVWTSKRSANRSRYEFFI
ncbi:hypothetical protein PO909_006570 [Leuciscus waleckii]